MTKETNLTAKSLLQDAAESGEVITLCYGGGSKPGAERQVAIIKVGLDDFRAREIDPTEPGSGHRGAKQFKLDKVIWVSDASGRRADGQLSDKPVEPVYKTLDQLSSACRAEFEATGWNVIEREDFFGLSRFFKNGKPKKTPVVSVQYSESVNLVYDLDTGDFIEEKVDPSRARPWRVDSERFSVGKSYGKVERAIALFLEEARALTP